MMCLFHDNSIILVYKAERINLIKLGIRINLSIEIMERKKNFPNYINGQYFPNYTKYLNIPPQVETY